MSRQPSRAVSSIPTKELPADSRAWRERLLARSIVTTCLLVAVVAIGASIAGSSTGSAMFDELWPNLRSLGLRTYAAIAVAMLLAGATAAGSGSRRARTTIAAVGAVSVAALAFASLTAPRLNDQGVWRTRFPSGQSLAELAATNPERGISTYWAAVLTTRELLRDAEIVMPPGTPYDSLWRAFASDIVRFDPAHDPNLPAGAATAEPARYEHPLGGEAGVLAIVGHGDVYRYYTTADGILLIGGS